MSLEILMTLIKALAKTCTVEKANYIGEKKFSYRKSSKFKQTIFVSERQLQPSSKRSSRIIDV